MKKNKPTIKEMVAAINTVEPWSDLRYINGKVYTNTYCCFEGAGIKEYSYREVHNIYKSMNKHYKSSSNSVQFFSKLTNRSNRHKSKVALHKQEYDKLPQRTQKMDRRCIDWMVD